MCNNNELDRDKNIVETEVRINELIDTIVQQATEKIQTKLTAVENKKGDYQLTWIWELIQNAVDNITKINNINKEDKKVDIEISFDEKNKELIFKHNNGYFTEDQLEKIILQMHGELNAENTQVVGRFGSGFITTYILSRNVKIKGRLQLSNGAFKNFEIDISRDKKDLKTSIGSSYKKYNEIINGTDSNENQDSKKIDTEFIYSEIEEGTSNLINTSIESFKKTIHLSKKFTNNLGSITINSNKININENEEILIFDDNNNNKFKIAIDCYDNNITNIVEKNIPNIFINYPLIKSNILKLPFVIHSLQFEPNEERSMIFLGKTGDASQINKDLLTIVFNRYIYFLNSDEISSKNNLFNLCRISRITDPNIEDNNFINDTLNNLVNRIIEIPIVKCNENEFLSLRKVKIPFHNDEGKREFIYKLLEQLRDFNLPVEGDIAGWNEILQSEFYKNNLNNSQTIYDIDKLISFIEDQNNFNNLKNKFKFEDNFTDENKEAAVWDWLNIFYELLDEKNTTYLDKRIFINENKNFISKSTFFNNSGTIIKNTELQYYINRRNYYREHKIYVLKFDCKTIKEQYINIFSKQNDNIDFRNILVHNKISPNIKYFTNFYIRYYKNIAILINNYIRDNFNNRIDGLNEIIRNLLANIIYKDDYVFPTIFSSEPQEQVLNEEQIKKDCFPYCFENKNMLSLRIMENNDASLLLNFVNNITDNNIREKILKFTTEQARIAIEAVENPLYEDDSNLNEINFRVPINKKPITENSNYMQINHQLLSKEYFIPNWECNTLFLGTFNPAGGEEVNYFYGRNSNNFWKAISKLFNKQEDGHFHNLMVSNFCKFKQFMIDNKFGCVDIIRSVVVNIDCEENITGKGYSDQNLFNMTHVARNYNFEEIENYIINKETVTTIINTVGQRFDNMQPKELKIQLTKFKNFCKVNNINYIENCPSVSGWISGEDNLNKIIEFYRENTNLNNLI